MKNRKFDIFISILCILCIDVMMTLIGYEVYQDGGPDTMNIISIAILLMAGLAVVWDTKNMILSEGYYARTTNESDYEDYDYSIHDDEWPEWDESDDEDEEEY